MCGFISIAVCNASLASICLASWDRLSTNSVLAVWTCSVHQALDCCCIWHTTDDDHWWKMLQQNGQGPLTFSIRIIEWQLICRQASYLMVMVRFLSHSNSSEQLSKLAHTAKCLMVIVICQLSCWLLDWAKKALGNVSWVTIYVISKPNISIARTTPLPLHVGSCRGTDLGNLIVKTIMTSQDLQGNFTKVYSITTRSSAVHLWPSGGAWSRSKRGYRPWPWSC